MDTAERAPVPTPYLELATLLHRLDLLRRICEQHAELGSADQRLMWLFSDHRPRTLREIAETLNLEQSTVNRQVNVALSEGLLRRYREPGRAARLVIATDEGLDRFRKDLALFFGIYEEALGVLDDADLARFLSLLGRFVDAYRGAVDRNPWS